MTVCGEVILTETTKDVQNLKQFMQRNLVIHCVDIKSRLDEVKSLHMKQ